MRKILVLILLVNWITDCLGKTDTISPTIFYQYSILNQWDDSLSSIQNNQYLKFNFTNDQSLLKPNNNYVVKVICNNCNQEILFFSLNKLYQQVEYIKLNPERIIDKSDLSIPFYKRRFLSPEYFFMVKASIVNDTSYFKIKTSVLTDSKISLYSTDWIASLIQTKVLRLGFFIGSIFILLIFCFILFFQMHESVYLYYFLYLASSVLYCLTEEGILLPLFSFIRYSHYWLTLFYMSVFISSLIYQRNLIKSHLLEFERLFFDIIISIRLLFFVIGTLFGLTFLNEAYIELLLMLPILYLYIKIVKRGAPHIKILFYSQLVFITFNLAYHLHKYYYLIYLNDWNIEAGYFYAGWLIDGFLFATILTERFKNSVHKNEIQALKSNVQLKLLLEKTNENLSLKHTMNEKLTELVNEKTRQLHEANKVLEAQSMEINEMNEFLRNENKKMQIDIELLKKGKKLSVGISFEDFIETFPTEEACLEFVAGIKWKNGFRCKNCFYGNSYLGNTPFSRKCKACKKQESATAFTILEATKFPLNKALFLIFRFHFDRSLNILKIAKTINLNPLTANKFYLKMKEKIHTNSVDDNWSSSILV